MTGHCKAFYKRRHTIYCRHVYPSIIERQYPVTLVNDQFVPPSTIPKTIGCTTRHRTQQQKHRPTNDEIRQLQNQITNALQLLQQEITIENKNTALHNKYQYHNQIAQEQRSTMMQQYLSYNDTNRNCVSRRKRQNLSDDDVLRVVGYDASCTVTLQTYIRLADGVIRNKFQQIHHLTWRQMKPGIHVRCEISKATSYLFQRIRAQYGNFSCQVYMVRSILRSDDFPDSEFGMDFGMDVLCDLALLSYVRRRVEQCWFQIVHHPDAEYK